MMTFLSPLLAWGMLLALIPLIIHLLNRRRFRRVEWAPMRYLKMTLERNKRRIEIEQLLLLLLRMALLLVLFFFLARPVLNPTGLERWLGSGGRSSQIVLLDDSLSMGFGAGASQTGPAFGRAKDVASALLSAARPQDRCTLVVTSAPQSPVLREVEATRRDELLAAVAGLPQTGTHTQWTAVLAAVDDVVRSSTYPTRQLTIITDLRKAGWEAGPSAVARRWAEKQAGVRVRVVDVGEDESTNVALLALVPLDRTILAGAESHWEATIKNDSARLLANAKAILRVDDRPTEVRLPDIPAHETVRVPLSVSFPGAGRHDLSLELPNDELPEDNRRFLAVPVQDSLLIRLVDGEPSSVPFGSEVDYLAAPLSIGIGAAEAWRVEVVPEEDAVAQKLDPADVLVLANVTALTPEQAERLRTMVRGGMGLLVFTGGKVDIGLYNDVLYHSTKLLPCPLKALVDESFHGVLVEPVRPSPLEALLELKPTALERVAVRQVMTVDEKAEREGEGDGGPGRERVQVLARWNNPARSAAIVERNEGEGRVLLWTTTADRAGNDWPIEPSFVLAAREAVRGSARPTHFDTTVTAGERMRRVVHSSQPLTNARVSAPGGSEPQALAIVPQPTTSDEQEPASTIDVPDTRQVGLYRMSWDEGPLGTTQELFAANPDGRESELARLSETDLKKQLAPLEVEFASARSDTAKMFAASGREVWHDLACGLFGLLVIESIFAMWVGRSR